MNHDPQTPATETAAAPPARKRWTFARGLQFGAALAAGLPVLGGVIAWGVSWVLAPAAAEFSGPARVSESAADLGVLPLASELVEPKRSDLTGDIGGGEPSLGELLTGTVDNVRRLGGKLTAPALDGDGVSFGRPSDQRLVGGRGGEQASVPRAQRWEIRFPSGANIDSYARQLDFFQIELAVVGAADNLIYASQLQQAEPVQRSGPAAAEQRLYFSWRRGDLRKADQELLARAGIPTVNAHVLLFIPAAVENQLAAEERKRAGDKPVSEIRRTVFEVRPEGEGFKFEVVDQTYLE